MPVSLTFPTHPLFSPTLLDIFFSESVLHILNSHVTGVMYSTINVVSVCVLVSLSVIRWYVVNGDTAGQIRV